MTSGDQLAVWGGITVALVAAPGLAGLTLTVPDRENRRWYLGARASLPRVGVTMALCLVLVTLAVVAAGANADLAAFVALALLATPLTIVDIEHHRLPDRLVVPGYVSGATGLSAAALVEGDGGRLLRSGEASVAVLGVFLVLALISSAALGLGDVKLVGVLAGYLAWIGWAQVVTGLFAGFALGAVASLVLVATHRATMQSNVAFGPALIIGTLCVAAFG